MCRHFHLHRQTKSKSPTDRSLQVTENFLLNCWINQRSTFISKFPWLILLGYQTREYKMMDVEFTIFKLFFNSNANNVLSIFYNIFLLVASIPHLLKKKPHVKRLNVCWYSLVNIGFISSNSIKMNDRLHGGRPYTLYNIRTSTGVHHARKIVWIKK